MKLRLSTLIVIIALLLSSCQLNNPFAPAPTPIPVPVTGGPVEITGSFDYTNKIIDTYYVENAVALLDMHGFVIRDMTWLLPVNSQVLGYLHIDQAKSHGTYHLDLPVIPEGEFNNVSNDGKADKGVQIFAVGYSPNLTGGPFSVNDDPSRGWPSYLASIKTDPENKDEVTGGKLVIWAPDDQQKFPTGFGPDGLLFTKDDPVGPIPAGWSVVDLDKKPFAIIRDQKQDLTLYEPPDVALKDYSKESYTQAFNDMFNYVKTYYAFNGIQGKQPNWDQLYAQVLPMVKDAEAKNNPAEFVMALKQYTYGFNDGHVGLSGAPVDQLTAQVAGSGYGFAIAKLDDGSYIVIFVTSGGPADKAGIKVGATISQFNGQPVADAVAKVQPLSAPQSTQAAIDYQKARYLLRAPVGTQAKVTFTNPNASQNTVDLTAVQETASFSYTSIYHGYNPIALPVEYNILNSGAGYIKIDSNYDDLNLIIRLFQRALTIFKENQVTGLIIDMRQNPGGADLGLAGFLYDKNIQMGQLEYYSTLTKKFEPEGPRDLIYPNVEQFRFAKMALLVGPACASACELESYGFSQVPGMVVVGQSGSSGTEAEVSRGQFNLPDGISLQVPTGRFLLPDGSLFLEGKGVQPTIKVPVTAASLLGNTDVVLQAAEKAVSGQ